MSAPTRGHYDVLVVGAGPAGAAAAAALARRGVRVLMAGPVPPRGATGYRVALPGTTAAACVSLGALDSGAGAPLDQVELRVGTATRTLPSSGMVTCDGPDLALGLRRAAIQAGAEHVADLLSVRSDAPGDDLDEDAPGDDRGRSTVRALVGGHAVTADHLILATGATDHADGVRYAWRCAVTGGSPVRDATMRIAYAAPDPSRPRQRPLAAWLVPPAGREGDRQDVVTLGAARFAEMPGAEPGELPGGTAALFVAASAAAAPDLTLVPISEPVSGRLDTGFTPARLRGAEAITCGDAAGLTNPFTAEGLSRAVDSGLLAADAVTRHLTDPAAARRDYARAMSARHVGHLEASRRAADHYHLTWRMIEGATREGHPFLIRLSRTAVLPDGPPLLGDSEAMDWDDPQSRRTVGPFLLACDEVAFSTVRGHWPFLAGAATGSKSLLRPSLLFAAGLAAAGSPPHPRHATMAAAVELASLGTLAFLGHGGGPGGSGGATPRRSRGVDWALASCTVAGDFLLAQASRLVATAAPELSGSFADWLIDVAAARAERLTVGPQLPDDSGGPDSQRNPAGPPSPDRPNRAAATAVFAELFEYPARVGAALSGTSEEAVEAFREAGWWCGVVFLHAEDTLALLGLPTRLGVTLETMVTTGLSATGLSVAMPVPGGRPHGGPAPRVELSAGQRAQALDASAAACREARDRALDALSAVADPVARRLATAVVTAIAAPGSVPGTAWPAGEPSSSTP